MSRSRLGCCAGPVHVLFLRKYTNLAFRPVHELFDAQMNALHLLAAKSVLKRCPARRNDKKPE